MASHSQTALLALGRAEATDGRLVAALDKTRSLLTNGEQIAQAAVQLRLHALFHRRLLMIATDRRVILLRRGVFGGFDMQDIAWQDVRDAQVSEHIFPNLLGADLTITAHDGRSCAITGADSNAARALYAFAQGQEQAWREKHRVRKMEELRAEAGGITVGSARSEGPHVKHDDVVAKLREARALLDERVISDVEYESLKAKILTGA